MMQRPYCETVMSNGKGKGVFRSEPKGESGEFSYLYHNAS